jgi:hypothetical protein
MADTRIEIQSKMFLLIEQWQQSGLPKKAFCVQHKVANATFHYWYKKYRQKDSCELTPFIPIRLKEETRISTTFAELILPDGRKLTLYNSVEASFLKSLLS